MGLRENLYNRLGLVGQRELESRINEAYASGYGDGNDDPVSGTTKSYGYRRMTTAGLRDFTLIDVDTVREIIWSLYQSNPIIRRANQIKRDYILDRGVSPQTEDEELQELLDGFWSTNKLDERQKEFVSQLFLFGEQCFPVFVREMDGRVKLGYLDPAEVDMVITHPENALELWAVVAKPITTINPWEQNKDIRIFRIVREEETESGGDIEDLEGVGEAVQELGNLWDPERSNQMKPYDGGNVAMDKGQDIKGFADKLFDIANQIRPSKFGLLVTHDQAILEDWEREMLQAFGLTSYSGSCFFFKVNSISNNPRGMPDYVQVADWTDQHDATLFNLADREQIASFISWDVTIDGEERQVKKRAKELAARPPKKGSVNVHNKEEEWEMIHPDIQATNSIETAKALLIQILGGLGIPQHWYGSGDETNRATAQAQGDPTWKTLTHDQGVVRTMLLSLAQFAKDQAQIAGTWKPSTDQETGEEINHDIEIPMPEMTARDTSMIASMLGTLSSALVVAEDQAWMTKENAREAWAKALKELDIELDLTEELPEPEEDQEPEAMGGNGREWSETHGAFLPSYAEIENWEALSPESQQELVITALERMGVTVPESLGI